MANIAKNELNIAKKRAGIIQQQFDFDAKMTKIKGKELGAFQAREKRAKKQFAVLANEDKAIAGNAKLMGDRIRALQIAIQRRTAALQESGGSVEARQGEIKAINSLRSRLGRLNEALKTLSDTAQESAAIEAEISKEQARRKVSSGLAEEFAFGTGEERQAMGGKFAAAATVAKTGDLSSIPEDMRKEALAVFKQFGDIDFAGAGTGKEIITALTASELGKARGRALDPDEMRKLFRENNKEQALMDDLRSLEKERQSAQLEAIKNKKVEMKI